MVLINSITNIIYLTTKQNFEKFCFVSISAIATKIVSDPRKINTQIKDIITKIKIELILNKEKIFNRKSRIKVIVYENKIILLGQINTIENFKKIENNIKKKINNNIKIFNEIRINNTISFKNFINDKFNFIKINLILLKFNIIKLSNVKILIENKEIFLIGICNRKDSITLLKIIQFFFIKNKIIPAFIHKDYIIIKNK